MFKVGDRVRVVSNSVFKDQVSSVVSVQAHTNGVNIVVKKSIDGGSTAPLWFRFSELELVESVESVNAKIERKSARKRAIKFAWYPSISLLMGIVFMFAGSVEVARQNFGGAVLVVIGVIWLVSAMLVAHDLGLQGVR